MHPPREVPTLLGEGDIENDGDSAATPNAGAGREKVSFLKCDADPSARRGPCHGCCGPGCRGCSGCYTSACRDHDNCVWLLGSASPLCEPSLIIAIASLAPCY